MEESAAQPDGFGDDSSSGVSRRGFLGRTAVAGVVAATVAGAGGRASADVAAGSVPGTQPDPTGDGVDSTFFSTVFIEHAGSLAVTTSDGDLWPNCWADDDATYAANGDGRGFSDQPFKDVVVNRIDGTPATGLTGVKLAESEQVANVWADPKEYNRKPTGMVCVDGVLYLAVQDLKSGTNAFDDVPNASISRSDDHGKTWKITSTAMFPDYRFTTIFFLDFGKNSENAVPALGRADGGYVYAYGLDWNWRSSGAGTVPDPVDMYLARVPAASVQDRAKWTFYTGMNHGQPQWSPRIEDKQAVLHDATRRYLDLRPGQSGNLPVISQGGVIYNKALKRYLYTSWTDPSFEFYESPTPWGPWKRFLYFNEGLVPWYRLTDATHTPKNGGYGTTIPAKFVSADGQDMWVQSNWWTGSGPTPADNYNFNLRRLRVTPYRWRPPTNKPAPKDNLARSGADVTTIQVCCHFANWKYLSDGDKTKSEDSLDNTNKQVDYWGYTFSRQYRLNRVAYTTGTMFPDGGWFTAYDGGLRVQVRQNFTWIDVDQLRVSPDYPYDSSAGSNTTYTFRFADTWGDGIRIIGNPGGSSFFTSVAELEVYYDG
ncbi:MAG TPA: hypothetical protein VHX59_14565 [Mycobacteriales bacterium]|nr:hypothetical protein [Mycobacteriales bacterium]